MEQKKEIKSKYNSDLNFLRTRQAKELSTFGHITRATTREIKRLIEKMRKELKEKQ